MPDSLSREQVFDFKVDAVRHGELGLGVVAPQRSPARLFWRLGRDGPNNGRAVSSRTRSKVFEYVGLEGRE